MDALDRDFLLVGPLAAKISRPTVIQSAGLSVNIQLGNRTLCEPVAIVLDHIHNFGRFAIKGNLARPGERRPAVFAWVEVWSAIRSEERRVGKECRARRTG